MTISAAGLTSAPALTTSCSANQEDDVTDTATLIGAYDSGVSTANLAKTLLKGLQVMECFDAGIANCR